MGKPSPEDKASINSGIDKILANSKDIISGNYTNFMNNINGDSNGFKCGLVGMPNVGKSSIFNLLTSQKIDAKNFPFCTIDPNIATVEVPDERLDKLSILNSLQKQSKRCNRICGYCRINKGSVKGRGSCNDFLTHIKNTDAIAHVVRFFIDDDIIHVNGKPDPDSDFSDINSELMLSDIATLESTLNRITKSKNSDKEKNILKDEVSNASTN